MDVEFDLKKSAVMNAQEHYEKAKKANEKLRGAEKALEETIERVEELKRKNIIEKEKTLKRKIVKEGRWYEKFRWFESSDNLLVVGGRDSTTNEILIKKHLEKNDLVFHADVHGAPFFVVKNPKKEGVPENTMREAAEAAASYSSSWKKGLGSCDVYQVEPEQVSKKAESGEYLPKGGFMIRGTKNWFRNTELKLAIGFVIEDEAKVIGGPANAITAKTRHYVEIGVGSLKSKELALEIKKDILRKLGKEDGTRVKRISVDEIQKFIPSGGGRTLS